MCVSIRYVMHTILLIIAYPDIAVYMNYSTRDYRKNQTRKRKVRNQYGGATLSKYASTFHGLQCWYHAKFEKLGWMVLAKEKGYDYKVESYKISLIDLLQSIEYLMAEYEDTDRIHDLTVMFDNVKCLQDFVMRNL